MGAVQKNQTTSRQGGAISQDDQGGPGLCEDIQNPKGKELLISLLSGYL